MAEVSPVERIRAAAFAHQQTVAVSAQAACRTIQHAMQDAGIVSGTVEEDLWEGEDVSFLSRLLDELLVDEGRA